MMPATTSGCGPNKPYGAALPQALRRCARLMGAYIARDHDCGREPRTVREFISEFRGLTGTAKQKAVLDAVGATRVTLPVFFGIEVVDRPRATGFAGEPVPPRIGSGAAAPVRTNSASPAPTPPDPRRR